jgi:ubiquinone/menaquinone biosynthesis C-methylase UbiE
MIATSNFEEQYVALRRKEQRLYTDEQVKWLPDIESLHPHYREWQLRKNSCNKLIEYLSDKRRKLEILEVGCGNGWLCCQLSTIQRVKITGIDINRIELEQARKVFGHLSNVEFLHADISEEKIRTQKFDIIVFAASIQYFRSLDKILSYALELLKPAGEIHILDSHFYRSSELAAAVRRSAEYFQSMGFPGMKEHYFHHGVDELKNYAHKVLYDPESINHLFAKRKNPFPWIRIKHKI